MNPIPLAFSFLFATALGSCQAEPTEHAMPSIEKAISTVPKQMPAAPNPSKPLPPLKKEDIQLDTALLFNDYTLKDSYLYKDIKRDFNWEQIKEALAHIENIQTRKLPWGVLQNYKNWKGEAPLVKSFHRNEYGRVSDSLGVERYQSVPLYEISDTLQPLIYGRDGTLVHIHRATQKFYLVESIDQKQKWYVPKKYVKSLPDSSQFYHVVVIDRKDQNITTLERQSRGKWLIRSKNPATTGRHKPPYAQPTPLGIFLIQEQKRKMVYLKDGSSKRGGFAPYASRFTNGAYIHGVPVQAPKTNMIEYSWSLGTVPRSHMCVRNATSHAKFIYEWAPVRQSLVVVLE